MKDRHYVGSIEGGGREGGGFKAGIVSAKARLAGDTIPLSSPSCRAHFCGPGCGLNPVAFETRVRVVAGDADTNSLRVDLAETWPYRYGELRWLDGPATGLSAQIIDAVGDTLTLAERIEPELPVGLRVRLREGCDRTIATCTSRFGNAVNFRGEPFLPGNDMLAQYPVAR